ncbi:hypothetical protein FEM48_Zijuj09G0126700 [Ziziphus jujuba var. spinosa]|uniref:C2 domain-containing protein n=1 Tax=Ziziphus jujuba var. spinosa TaxID=714518 RepID=A0A978UT24_ZIZJJ|nr:hypothetical protein FEM48_Zijuj09G0126700 [Ziziphus jujuba var. spinosa]
MSVYGIQGQILEVTVVGCNKLKDTEWISRQDPYVCLEYASTKFRTKTCTDGGKNPTFQEKFVFTLIEGLRELNVVVGNSNTLTSDGYIGSGKVQLQKVLSQGYDDSPWSLQTKTGRYAGEVRLVLHYGNANKATTSYTPSAPPYVAPPTTQAPLYSAPPPAPIHCYPPPSTVPSYPPPGSLSPYPQVQCLHGGKLGFWSEFAEIGTPFPLSELLSAELISRLYAFEKRLSIRDDEDNLEGAFQARHKNKQSKKDGKKPAERSSDKGKGVPILQIQTKSQVFHHANIVPEQITRRTIADIKASLPFIAGSEKGGSF